MDDGCDLGSAGEAESIFPGRGLELDTEEKTPTIEAARKASRERVFALVYFPMENLLLSHLVNHFRWTDKQKIPQAQGCFLAQWWVFN